VAHKTEIVVAATVSRLLYLLLAGAVFVADRLTKILIESSLALHETRVVVPGFFHIVHVRNEGIAFGLFADSPSAWKTWVLVLLSAAALAAVGYVLWTSTETAAGQNAALALILGGAAGNLFDRAATGGVVDFLDFFLADWHWPAFNLADSAIVAGGGLLLLHLTRAQTRRRR
jgi:signal peptidase II